MLIHFQRIFVCLYVCFFLLCCSKSVKLNTHPTDTSIYFLFCPTIPSPFNSCYSSIPCLTYIFKSLGFFYLFFSLSGSFVNFLLFFFNNIQFFSNLTSSSKTFTSTCLLFLFSFLPLSHCLVYFSIIHIPVTVHLAGIFLFPLISICLSFVPTFIYQVQSVFPVSMMTQRLAGRIWRKVSHRWWHYIWILSLANQKINITSWIGNSSIHYCFHWGNLIMLWRWA